MGKRKIPFGYRMEMGEITVHPKESSCVHTIFNLYRRGSSFGDLVDLMKNHGVPYDSDKLWNKNMVARILEDERYTGTDSYPVIILREEFDSVAELRKTKRITSEVSDTQKWLRKICDATVTDDIERMVLFIVNRMISNPEIIHEPEMIPHGNATGAEMYRKLEEVLSRQPIDEESAQMMAAEIAASEYRAIKNSGYETERIRQILLCEEPMNTLKLSVSREIVKRVLVSGKGEVRLQLKNGQIIERSVQI